MREDSRFPGSMSTPVSYQTGVLRCSLLGNAGEETLFFGFHPANLMQNTETSRVSWPTLSPVETFPE
jgi:hypothetical protein